MFFAPHRCLVLAPHTDDGEFGCGGTIAKLVERGVQVHYVAFSDCVNSLPAGWPADTLVRELEAATARLGLSADRVVVHSFPVRHFTRDRQEILDVMVELQSELRPDLVLMPSVSDLHQDHETIAREGLRAFKRTTILAYEIPWNNIQFRNELFVGLEPAQVQRKIDALGCYESQSGRYYANEEFVRAQARMRGCQVGREFAEVFEVLRAVVA
jgi:N-acetylglucosamine malate deacetylase 1